MAANLNTVTNDTLNRIREALELSTGKPPRAWQIKEELTKLPNPIFLDESTIRGRFIEMGIPLSGGIGAGAGATVLTREAIKGKLQDIAKRFGINNAQDLMKEFGISDYNNIPEGLDLQGLHDKAEELLTGKVAAKPPKPTSKPIEIIKKAFTIPDHLKMYIPQPSHFVGYVERPVDARLAIHYNSSRPGNWKYPLTQGKQGTGKTYSHMHYAFKEGLPFYLFCAYEDFKLHKLFGDKTIENGNVVFKEGLLTQAIQHPGVILIDEVNYISNENSVDFHAFLQNRELFVKDADNGNGKIYKLHDDCKIGFAQNPKSAKYIGGNIKPSNFLGRCTYITYPEFTKQDIRKAIESRFPNLVNEDISKFTEFYFACLETIDQANIPVDISIRQLNNVIDLYNHGLPLNMAIEDGLSAIMDAASQPKSKEAFMKLGAAVWKELLDKTIGDKVGAVK